jgi:hypothetical protein
MQNRYVGDIGDYLKLAILRGYRLDIGSVSLGGSTPSPPEQDAGTSQTDYHFGADGE